MTTLHQCIIEATPYVIRLIEHELAHLPPMTKRLYTEDLAVLTYSMSKLAEMGYADIIPGAKHTGNNPLLADVTFIDKPYKNHGTLELKMTQCNGGWSSTSPTSGPHMLLSCDVDMKKCKIDTFACLITLTENDWTFYAERKYVLPKKVVFNHSTHQIVLGEAMRLGTKQFRLLKE